MPDPVNERVERIQSPERGLRGVGPAQVRRRAEITVDKLGENSLLDHATRNVSEVLTQQVPVIRSGEFVNEEGETAMFRSILLPLSQDQATINCVVGGARCKVKRPS